MVFADGHRQLKKLSITIRKACIFSKTHLVNYFINLEIEHGGNDFFVLSSTFKVVVFNGALDTARSAASYALVCEQFI